MFGKRLSSFFVAALLFASSISPISSIAQTDTVWKKDGAKILCVVLELVENQRSSGVIKYQGPTGFSKVDLSIVEKFSWNGTEYRGDVDWKDLSCDDFPFISFTENKSAIATVNISNEGYSKKAISKESIKRFEDWGKDNANAVVTSSVEEDWVHIIGSRVLQSIDEDGYSHTVKVGLFTLVQFTDNVVVLKCRVTDVAGDVNGTPFEALSSGYKRKNGKVKSGNFKACIKTNNAISINVAQIRGIVNGVVSDLKRLDEIRTFRSSLVEGYSTNTPDDIEGIWSVDVSFSGSGNYFPQAFEVAIVRQGQSYSIVPLTLNNPSFDWSIKTFATTAEPTVFLMQAWFPDEDYTTNATLYQSSFGLAKFTIQVPSEAIMKYCSDNGLKYVGNERLTYNLVKVEPQARNGNENPVGSKSASWTGTGFAVNSEGIIATNNHVVEGAKRIVVRGNDGNKDVMFEAKVIAQDKVNDLALLQIENRDEFARLGNVPFGVVAEEVKLGSEVFSIGFPQPGVFNEAMIVTNGIVSGLSGPKNDDSRYQMTTPITHGNSGGPIFNKFGQVIGVSVAGYLDIRLMLASFSVKTKHLVELLNKVSDYFPERLSTSGESSIESHVDEYQKFVFLIEAESSD